MRVLRELELLRPTAQIPGNALNRLLALRRLAAIRECDDGNDQEWAGATLDFAACVARLIDEYQHSG